MHTDLSENAERKCLNMSAGTDRSSLSNDRRNSGVSTDGASTPTSFSPGTSPSASSSPFLPVSSSSSSAGRHHHSVGDEESTHGLSYERRTKSSCTAVGLIAPTNNPVIAKKKGKTRDERRKKTNELDSSTNSANSTGDIVTTSSTHMPQHGQGLSGATAAVCTLTTLSSSATNPTRASSRENIATSERGGRGRLPMNVDLDSLEKKVKPRRCEADIFRDGFHHFLQSGDYSDLTLECEVRSPQSLPKSVPLIYVYVRVSG